MPQSFADYYGIDPDFFSKTGALDPILGIDTKLFIDPSLLRGATTPELEKSFERVQEHFTDVVTVISNIGEPGDRLWRQADQMLDFPEFKGLCIGYSKGKDGSGMGPKLRRRVLQSIMEIVAAGEKDPAIFELVGAFEDDIGPDRISDMVAKIILQDLIAFTQRVCSDCGIGMKSQAISKRSLQEDLPTNPLTGDPIILVPMEVLGELPVADTYADIGWIASQNQNLRDRFNAIVGKAFSKLTPREHKHLLKKSFIESPDILKMVIAAYREAKRSVYNFDSDPAGEVIWYRASRNVARDFPLKLSMSEEPTREEVEVVVGTICNHFKTLIEDNQLCNLLYDEKGVKKRESAAQLLFFGIASAYCKANDLDLTGESDAGRGPVDFKASRGFREKVLVELKLTTNPNLVSGFLNQLPIYQKAENTSRGVYLVIHNGGSDARLAALMKEVAAAGSDAPRVILVDGIPRPSASKADTPD
ncbi:hypothetical protein [Paraburkholderia aspalathi]|uniref:hypothetical protein n=1 Tax=Paraburkholderia aspalathi TaxID=1324617 RepID=UPI0038BA23A6